MKNRRKARELSLQVLYQMNIRGISAEEALKIIFSRYRFRPEVKKFCQRLTQGTSQFLSPIDSLIKKYAKNWTLERMAILDRNILRFAIYELFFLEEIPPVVSINEAVEIAKRYGTPDSGKFVNGILDKIRKERGKNSSLKWTYLRDVLLESPYLKRLIEIKGKEKIWLVGGCIRDFLLDRENKDLDLIVEDGHFRVAQEFASQLKARLINLNITSRRIVLPEGTIIDFTLKRSPSLKADLLQRDFTINALALDLDFLVRRNFQMPSLVLIDPDTGLEDLINKKIRLMREKSLDEDPLRMFRTFRLASELDFSIDERIAHLIQEKSPLIKKISRERIRDELFLFFKTPLSYRYLENSSAKMLLKELFGRTPDVENLKRLEMTLSQEGVIPEVLRKKIILHLERNEGRFRRRGDLLKLMALISLTSPGEPISSSMGRELRLGQKEIRIMKRVEEFYPELKKIKEDPHNFPLITQFLMQTREETIEILLLFLIANLDQKNSLKLALFLLKEYFQKSSLILHPPKLIDGEELMKSLGLSPGPQISYLLNKIHQAQIMEKVITKEEALKLAKEFLQEIPD